LPWWVWCLAMCCSSVSENIHGPSPGHFGYSPRPLPFLWVVPRRSFIFPLVLSPALVAINAHDLESSGHAWGGCAPHPHSQGRLERGELEEDIDRCKEAEIELNSLELLRILFLDSSGPAAPFFWIIPRRASCPDLAQKKHRVVDTPASDVAG
jgi:hypothetical protein